MRKNKRKEPEKVRAVTCEGQASGGVAEEGVGEVLGGGGERIIREGREVAGGRDVREERGVLGPGRGGERGTLGGSEFEWER